MEEIKIKDYFNMIYDDYHRLVAIQSIGDERELINAIRNQNDELKRLEQENAELKEKLESYNCNANCYKYKEANKYKQALEEIREDILCYQECYEGTPDGCINRITDKIEEVLK